MSWRSPCPLHNSLSTNGARLFLDLTSSSTGGYRAMQVRVGHVHGERRMPARLGLVCLGRSGSFGCGPLGLVGHVAWVRLVQGIWLGRPLALGFVWWLDVPDRIATSILGFRGARGQERRAGRRPLASGSGQAGGRGIKIQLEAPPKSTRRRELASDSHAMLQSLNSEFGRSSGSFGLQVAWAGLPCRSSSFGSRSARFVLEVVGCGAGILDPQVAGHAVDPSGC